MTSISNGAAITAPSRNNVLALQRTQSAIDDVQQRLATGKKVGSSIDNPGHYFTASSLNNRAVQLSRTLDGIGRKLSVLQQANEAVSSLSELITQAKGIAENAQAEFSGTTQEAKITGDRSLTNVTDVPTNLAGVDDGDRLNFSFLDSTGSFDTTNLVTISTGESINDIIDEINAFTKTDASQVFEASLNSAGQLEIKTKDNTRFEIEFQTSGGAADTQLATALGFGDFDTSETDDGTTETRITVLSAPALTSGSLFDASSGPGAAGTTTTLANLTNSSSGSANDIFDGDSDDALNISVDGGTAIEVVDDISTATIQDLLDGINNNASLNTKIKASFDTSSSELTIRAIDTSVDSIQIELEEDGAGAGTAGKIDLQKLGFGTRVLQSAADGSGNVSSESFQLGSSASTLAGLEVQFDAVRTQIDALIDDAEFDGLNLLASEDVITVFNETSTSSLTTEGQTLTAEGLGISAANFGSSADVTNAVAEITAATQSVENFASGLATDISIITTRQSYTDETIGNLEEGAGRLTDSDANEDGAELLALQTRQLLGVTALSLASQSQQSTLRLF